MDITQEKFKEYTELEGKLSAYKLEIEKLTFEKNLYKGGLQAVQRKLDTAITILQNNDNVGGAKHKLFPLYKKEIEKLYDMPTGDKIPNTPAKEITKDEGEKDG